MQIDQSGKIEDTSKHTILALAGDTEFAILIPARVKRQLQEAFRKMGKHRLFVFKVFAIGVYLLLKHYPARLHRVVVDIEYFGHEEQITEMISAFAKQEEVKLPEIVWSQIGKGVRADVVAWEVARKKRLANKLLTFKEILQYICME